MFQWYAVHTKARQEQVAKEHLARQMFDTYLPTVRNVRRRRSRWHDVVEPLFPGYLFVHLDVAAQDVSPIRSTRGVIGLVRFANALRPVPDKLIDAINHAHNGNDQEPIDCASQFKSGDEVRFVEGPLTGMTAIFQSRSGAERVAVLLSLLGRPQLVVISPHVLSKVY